MLKLNLYYSIILNLFYIIFIIYLSFRPSKKSSILNLKSVWPLCSSKKHVAQPSLSLLQSLAIQIKLIFYLFFLYLNIFMIK